MNQYFSKWSDQGDTLLYEEEPERILFIKVVVRQEKETVWTFNLAALNASKAKLTKFQLFVIGQFFSRSLKRLHHLFKGWCNRCRKSSCYQTMHHPCCCHLGFQTRSGTKRRRTVFWKNVTLASFLYPLYPTGTFAPVQGVSASDVPTNRYLWHRLKTQDQKSNYLGCRTPFLRTSRMINKSWSIV